MEGSTQEGLGAQDDDGGTTEPTEEKKGKEPTQYVVLVRDTPANSSPEYGGGEVYALLTDEDDAPIVCEAHRREDVIADLVEENKLPVEEDGDKLRTPYTAVIPARSFKPIRWLVGTRRVSVSASEE